MIVYLFPAAMYWVLSSHEVAKQRGVNATTNFDDVTDYTVQAPLLSDSRKAPPYTVRLHEVLQAVNVLS